MTVYMHRVKYKMSMLMRMYYFSVLMLVGMDISIIYFFVTKRIFYHNQCADYHNAEGDIKFYFGLSPKIIKLNPTPKNGAIE